MDKYYAAINYPNIALNIPHQTLCQPFVMIMPGQHHVRFITCKRSSGLAFILLYFLWFVFIKLFSSKAHPMETYEGHSDYQARSGAKSQAVAQYRP